MGELDEIHVQFLVPTFDFPNFREIMELSLSLFSLGRNTHQAGRRDGVREKETEFC